MKTSAAMKILEYIYKESTVTKVRRDDTISLKLFTAILEEAFKNLKWEKVTSSDKWRTSK